MFTVFSSKSHCMDWRQGLCGLQCGIQTCSVEMTSWVRWWCLWRIRCLMTHHHTGTSYKRGWDNRLQLFVQLCSILMDLKVAKMSLLASPYLSVCLHVTTQEPSNRFSWNVMLDTFYKTCQHIPVLVSIRQKYQAFYMNIYMYFYMQKWMDGESPGYVWNLHMGNPQPALQPHERILHDDVITQPDKHQAP